MTPQPVASDPAGAPLVPTPPPTPVEGRLFDMPASDAVISEDGRYRYTLTRTWDIALPVLVWVMLNPSTADWTLNDPTIRRCIDFAKRFGYGGIVAVNLFALRASNPAELRCLDPVGLSNNEHLLAQTADRDVVCAWGASVPDYWRHRPAAIVKLLRGNGARLHHLGLTKERHPRHPLYVRGDTPLTRWAS